MRAKGVPVKQRKYLLRMRDMLKRGILTFEYLQRRTNTKPCKKLTIPTAKSGAKKGVAKEKK